MADADAERREAEVSVAPAQLVQQRDDEARAVLATEPDAYASGNPGCLVQVSAALRRAERPLPAYHPVELVDASIRGLSTDQLLQEARR